MQAVIGLLLTLAVVGHGLPSSPISPAPPQEATSSSPLSPTISGTITPSLSTTESPKRRSQVDQVIVLPHEIHRDPQHPDSKALLKVVGELQKKDPIIKGLLVNHNIGKKFFLLKPESAGKAISLKNLRGETENSHREVKKVAFQKGAKTGLKSKTGVLSRQKRFIFSLRNIALPLSIFHYLGFLPMRVPGLPYHIDPGLPDYTEYEPYNDLAYPDPPIRSRSSLYGRQ